MAGRPESSANNVFIFSSLEFLVVILTSLLLVLFTTDCLAQTERGFGTPSIAAGPHGRRLVMVIGIDQYRAWPRLSNAVNDASGFARELNGKLGFQEAAPPLLNQNATRQAIESLVDDVLYRELTPDDELVLFFAGHGTTRVDQVGGRDVETGFLVPVEARGPGPEEEYSDYIQVDQFLAAVGRLRAHHILVILDACHSGFALGRAMEGLRGDIRYREDLAGHVSRKVITSARRNQSATDRGPIPDHSLFTGVLIEGLESGAADLDGDGVVTSSELGLYLQQAVGRYSESAQTPDFGSFYLDDRGELVIPIGTGNPGGIKRTNAGRRSVALLGFKNLSERPEQAWLSTALAEMLSTELAAGDRLRTISGENVARMKRDLSLADAETLSPDTLGRIYRSLGSDLVVLGSYLDVNNEIRVDIRVQDATSGETIAAVSRSGTENEVFDLVNRLGAELREKCGAGEISDLEAGTLSKAHPSQRQALRLYAEGLNKLRNFEPLGARSLLEQAVAVDPQYAPAHSALAEAWSLLGYDDKGKIEAKLAFESSKDLPRKDALLVEARYQETSGDFQKATDIYKSLWTFFPDELDYGLHLANAEVEAGKGGDVAAVIRLLRLLPRPMRDDPRIDLVEANAADSLSDYKREADTALRAIDKAKRSEQRLLEAQGFQKRCWAFRNLGDFSNAKEAGERAQDLSASLGDFMDLARAVTCLGTIAGDQGNYQTARELHERALTLATKIGSELDVVGALINIGTVAQAQNDLPEAANNYQKSLSVALQIADRQDELQAENNLGVVFSLQGDFDAAKQMYQRSLATASETGDQGGMVEATDNLGGIDYLRGDLLQARTKVEAAIKTAQGAGMQPYAALALNTLGDILSAQGDDATAEKQYRESLNISQRTNFKLCTAVAQLSLAGLKFQKDSASEAESLAREALKEFEAEKNVDQQAAAHDILAQVLALEGKLPEAEIEIDRARGLAAQDQAILLSRSITSGHLLALAGKYDEATQELQGALDRARAMGLIGWGMQASLALAESQLLAGHIEQARAALAFLQSEATERGYASISRKAATMQARAHVSMKVHQAKKE